MIAARTTQGIATGAAISAFTAAAVEYTPAKHKKTGVLTGSVAPAAGLGLGALIAGIAVQFTAAPSPIVFTFLAVLFVLGMIVVIASGETVPRRAGAFRSLTQRVSVPQRARSEFFASIPVNIATWMLGGLYLGLVPSIMYSVYPVLHYHRPTGTVLRRQRYRRCGLAPRSLEACESSPRSLKPGSTRSSSLPSAW